MQSNKDVQYEGLGIKWIHVTMLCLAVISTVLLYYMILLNEDKMAVEAERDRVVLEYYNDTGRLPASMNGLEADQ